MNSWEVISEEASIVLVGNFNPKIFHPEWFIRKEIVAEWDYSNDHIISLPDMSEMELPNELKISAFLNKFQIITSLATEYFSLKDIVVNTFSLLSETPITQIGINLTTIIRIPDIKKWRQFGSNLAPQTFWKDAAKYIESLEENKETELGLWELTMNLPRPDSLVGWIRPTIAAMPQAGSNK